MSYKHGFTFSIIANMEPHCSATNGWQMLILHCHLSVAMVNTCMSQKLSFGLWVVSGCVAYSFLTIVVNEGTTLSEVVC